MMNRRDALKTLAVTSAAALAGGLVNSTSAAEPVAGALFALPDLPFAPEALEPHIDALTMQIHHGKHHAAYVSNLNKAIASHPELAEKSVESLIGDLSAVPEDIRTAVRNNGGGHANHSLFWKSLSPQGGEPEGALLTAIVASFGSFAAFQEKLAKAALGQFGSGWAWLSLDSNKKLLVEGLPNQDSPLMNGRQPVFGIDVWEHAYYLHYQNRRADYVKAIWNVVNWPFVSARYAELTNAG